MIKLFLPRIFPPALSYPTSFRHPLFSPCLISINTSVLFLFKFPMHDFGLTPRCKWALRSSEISHNVDCRRFGTTYRDRQVVSKRRWQPTNLRYLETWKSEELSLLYLSRFNLFLFVYVHCSFFLTASLPFYVCVEHNKSKLYNHSEVVHSAATISECHWKCGWMLEYGVTIRIRFRVQGR